MKRRQKRKIALLAILVLLLALVGAWYINYRSTGNINLPDLRAGVSDTLEAPQFMFAFSGTGANQLNNPVGVYAYNGQVFVADSVAGLVYVFNQPDGHFVRSFGKGHLTTPLYLQVNPKDGDLYVTDRRQRSIEVFTTAGRWVKTFNPNLPKAELPKFATHGEQWAPVAVGFAPDGTMYVTEILNGHRMLIFNPDGTFLKSVGGYGLANSAGDVPGMFQFPNSVKVLNDIVYVVDSNNHRVELFKKDGTYLRMINMSGLPRGMVFLPTDLTAAGAKGTTKFAIVDTLSHNVTLWDTTGSQLLTFGTQGNADGTFNFPDDITLGDRDVLFVSDTLNRRIEAWGWQAKISPLPRILPRQSYWYLFLLPLLLLPLLFRRRKLYATADFVQAMYDAQSIHLMTEGRVKWYVSEADYAKLKDLSQDGIELSELLTGIPYSETDAFVLAEKYNLSDKEAAVLAFAQRAKVIHTENADLVRQARLLELDTIDKDQYAAAVMAKAKAKK